jgi:beta-lactamase class A
LSDLGGRVGLQLRSAGEVIAEREAGEPHYAASTMKLAVLGALLRSWADGERPGPVPATDRFESAVGGEFTLRQADDQDDPTWARLGQEISTEELTERMIVVSSNLATDLLASRLGLGRVQDFLTQAGLAGQVDVRRLIGDAAAEAAGITNTVTAAGLARLLEGLTDGSLLGAEGARRATALLAGQTHLSMIPAGLPAGTWSASKGGWVDGVNHDVALVHPESAPDYVLAICTSTGLSHDAGCALVAELSRITWEHWTTWHS